MVKLSENGTVTVTLTPEEFLANVKAVYNKLRAAKEASRTYEPSNETYEAYHRRRQSEYGDMVADALGALESHISFAEGFEIKK